MTFVIELQWNSSQTLVERFQCVGLDRKKDLTEPFFLSRGEILARLQTGEIFQMLDKISCRWEVGGSLEIVETRGKTRIVLNEKDKGQRIL